MIRQHRFLIGFLAFTAVTMTVLGILIPPVNGPEDVGGYIGAWLMALTVLGIGGAVLDDVKPPKARVKREPKPKPAPVKPPAPTVADLSAQAEQARAHAVKYGLPTAVWDGLAAMWDAIAEQDAETVGKAAQRPTPPKGRAGVWSPIPLLSVDRVETTGHADGGPTDTPTAWSLPKVTSTTPPSGLVLVNGYFVEIEPQAHTTRYDLVCWRTSGDFAGEHRPVVVQAVSPDAAAHEPLHDSIKVLARVEVRDGWHMITDEQITDLRATTPLPRTHEVEGDNGEVRTVDENGRTVSIRRPIIDTNQPRKPDWDPIGMEW